MDYEVACGLVLSAKEADDGETPVKFTDEVEEE